MYKRQPYCGMRIITKRIRIPRPITFSMKLKLVLPRPFRMLDKVVFR